MKFGVSKYLVIILSAMLICSCAHRQHVRAGDAAMEQQEPDVAVQHYRTAQRMKPSSQRIQERLEAAEEEVLIDSLGAIERKVSGGDIDRAVVEGRRAANLLDSPERLDILEARTEQIVLKEGRIRHGEGDYKGALKLIDIHVETFGEALAPVAELDELIRGEWGKELRQKGQSHMAAGRHGAAAVYFVKANDIEGVGDGGIRAIEARRRVVMSESWGIDVHGDMADLYLERTVNEVFDHGFSAPIVDGRDTSEFGLATEVELSISEPEFVEWDEYEERSGEYQSGTKMAPNPAYETKLNEVYRAEERVLEAERDVTAARRDLREARRELRNRKHDGRDTWSAENRVDREYRTLDRRERQLDDRRYEKERLSLQLRQIDQYREVPVYRTHYYSVTLQWAEISTAVRVELSVIARGFSTFVEFELRERAMSEWYRSQPKLNLPGNQDSVPSKEELRGKLDEELGENLRRFIDESFELYRKDRLGDLSNVGRDEAIDTLARFVMLNPEVRNSDLEEQLNNVVEFEDGANLLIRLSRDEVYAR